MLLVKAPEVVPALLAKYVAEERDACEGLVTKAACVGALENLLRDGPGNVAGVVVIAVDCKGFLALEQLV